MQDFNGLFLQNITYFVFKFIWNGAYSFHTSMYVDNCISCKQRETKKHMYWEFIGMRAKKIAMSLCQIEVEKNDSLQWFSNYINSYYKCFPTQHKCWVKYLLVDSCNNNRNFTSHVFALFVVLCSCLIYGLFTPFFKCSLDIRAWIFELNETVYGTFM